MPSDMDHLHGTDTRDERIAELHAENERLRKELYDWKAKHFEDCGKAKLSGYEEGRKEAAREAFAIALEMQKAYSIKAANATSLLAVTLWNDMSTGAMRVKRAISKHFGLDAKPEPKVKIGEGGVVVVAPAGDSPLRELYESPEFRAAWANREEK
jgi:hypothetical protein